MAVAVESAFEGVVACADSGQEVAAHVDVVGQSEVLAFHAVTVVYSADDGAEFGFIVNKVRVVGSAATGNHGHHAAAANGQGHTVVGAFVVVVSAPDGAGHVRVERRNHGISLQLL